jgi:hypothetical protein
LRTSIAATITVIGALANAIGWAQPSLAASVENRDCGVAFACFEQSLDQGVPANIRISTGDSGAGQTAPPLIVVRSGEFDDTRVTAHFELEGAAASCRLPRAALRGIVQDAAVMGSISPLSFGIADQCQGTLFDSWWAAAHNIVLSLPPAVSAPAGYADCGWSTACLVGHTQTKAPAAGRQLTLLPLFGLLLTSVSYVQIGDFDKDLATVYLRTDRNTAAFAPESIQAMKAKGATDADIGAAQAKASASAASAVGLDGTCRTGDAMLVGLLRRWYAGSYSSDDWNGAETCSGKMFASWHKA